MAKDLPYFKFYCSEWDNGNVTLCSLEAQGLFVNLCSLYWQKEGKLDLSMADQKVLSLNKVASKELQDRKIFRVVKRKIVIGFLNEQLQERAKTSDKRRKSANDRWYKSNASAMQVHSPENSSAMQLRGEERRGEESIKHSYSFNQLFALATNSPYSLPEDRDRRMVGREVDELVYELKQNGFSEDQILKTTTAMKGVYRINGQVFPTKPDTFITSFKARDWIKELEELDPERKAETIANAKRNGKHYTPQFDEIGTSAPGSLG